jgi:mannosylglycerate hydrolase
VAVLLEHAMEYEVLDGRELALTVLRATGLISRSAHRFREAPAGPELAVPDGQCRGPRSVGFALLPHPGAWHEDGVLEALERYLHPFLVVPGGALDGPRRATGPELRGDGIVLSSLRRGGRRLEATVACEHPLPVRGTFGGAELDLRAWEIQGVELR